MLVVCLSGELERPFHEVVKLKPELLWRTQDIRDASVIGYLPTRASNQPKKNKHVTVNKAEWNWSSEELFDTRHGDSELEVCLAGFWFCFSLVFPHSAPFPTCWNGNVLQNICLYYGKISLYFTSSA